MKEVEEAGQQTIGDAVMDMLHAEPRSDAPEVNAIGQLPRSEVEAILRAVDHPLHAAAVEHRRLLNLTLGPMVERVSRVLNGFMRSTTASDITRSIGIVQKYADVVARLNASTTLPGVEAARRELVAIGPVLNTLGQNLAADLVSTGLAQRNAALMTKLAAMRPPPRTSTAPLGESVRDIFGLTRPAPDPLVGLADLVAQAPRGLGVAARQAEASRYVPVTASTADGQTETNRLLAAIVEILDEQRADGPRTRAYERRVEFVAWVTLLVAVLSLLGDFRAPTMVEQNINIFVVEGQALDNLPSQTPAVAPSLPPAGCLDEPTVPVPSTAPECVPRSSCVR